MIFTEKLTQEFGIEFGCYDFINLYYEKDEFFSIHVQEEKEQCLKENCENFQSLSDFQIMS